MSDFVESDFSTTVHSLLFSSGFQIISKELSSPFLLVEWESVILDFILFCLKSLYELQSCPESNHCSTPSYCHLWKHVYPGNLWVEAISGLLSLCEHETVKPWLLLSLSHPSNHFKILDQPRHSIGKTFSGNYDSPVDGIFHYLNWGRDWKGCLGNCHERAIIEVISSPSSKKSYENNVFGGSSSVLTTKNIPFVHSINHWSDEFIEFNFKQLLISWMGFRLKLLKTAELKFWSKNHPKFAKYQWLNLEIYPFKLIRLHPKNRPLDGLSHLDLYRVEFSAHLLFTKTWISRNLKCLQ
jgi:hypothetical protein